MVKGRGKRYSSISNDGKWYAHPGLHGAETSTTSTTTGAMLSQIASALPKELQVERHLKSKKQKSPEFQFSTHDNREAIQDNICVFSQGLGRKKCPGDIRQHNSHFCLCQDDPGAGSGSGSGGSSSVRDRTPTACHQTEYSGTQNRAAETVHVTHNRRFPHSHQQRAAKAAAAQAQQAGGHFMWFGRHDSEDHLTPLEVLAATN